jgi:tetratricopeptide (TPR) repeat protein
VPKNQNIIQPKTSSNKVEATDPIAWKWICFFIALVAFALYANTLHHDYTVDDGTVIANNKFTKEGISSIGKIFSSAYRAGYWDRNEGLYRPLSVAMFAVEWQLGGGKPFLGHLINVLLYVCTAVVVLSLLKRLLNAYHPLIPVIAALLFVVHPIHTEVVANIKSRDEILSFLFGCLSLRLLFMYVDRNKLSFFIASLFAFIIALLSKETTLTWLGVIPIALWCCTNFDIKKTIVTSLPFFVIIVLFVFLRMSILGSLKGETEILLINNSLLSANGAVFKQMATAFSILFRYLVLMVAPITLIFDYSFNTIPSVGFGDFRALLGLILILTGLFVGIKSLVSRSIIGFAILFFLGTIVLLSNVFFLIEATMAERFMYTPSFGICILFAVGIGNFINADKKEILSVSALKSNRGLISFILVLTLLFGGRTIARNADWKDNITLLSTDIKSAPNSARILYAYGSAILIEQALKENDPTVKNNLLDQSIEYLRRGVTVIPNYNDAWYNLGIAYKERGNAKDAIASFETARSYKPFKEASKFVNAGIAYGMNQQYDKAISDLQRAYDLDPTSTDAMNNLGLYLGEAGNASASFEMLGKAIAAKPDFDKAYYNRGNIWAKNGNYRNAIEDYKKTLQLNSSYGDAYNNLGNCYAALQTPDSAMVWFEKAIATDPSNVKAVINLSITYRILGDTVKANEYLQKARLLGAAI